MITGEIKNQIDAIWRTFWTGGITNGIDVVEQMTYLFFMKMLDDAQLAQEANASILGLEGREIPGAVFKKGLWHNPDTQKDIPYKSLRWSVFHNYSPKEMYDTIRYNVFPFIKNLNSTKDSAYSRFMSDAVFLIQQPRTLTKVIEGINDLDMNNRDTMGDVYEYILGKMAEKGTNGQFRTPRHIISMIVELMEPKVNDKICDPAMGSAGFLMLSAQYLKKHHPQELLNQNNARHFRTVMFSGFDTDPKMLRIGSMNLMLNGIDNPNVRAQDSLSNQNTIEDFYSLILANPPFSGTLDKEVISDSLLTTVDTKKTELLFISLFIRMLEMGGRCASIVPNGVLSNMNEAYIKLRQELVDHQNLQAVISMPSGVFKPSASVSTAIIIFTKTNSQSTDKVWFYDMKADGYSLDDKQKEIDDNDIPDIINRFHNLKSEADRPRNAQSFFVPVQELRNSNYSLAFNKYHKKEQTYTNFDAPQTIINRIESLQNDITNAINELKNIIL